ncbi:NADPH-dependent glutamate synthase beta subunit-like oxidoreductase [Halanaerobium saccharolyticum]|uniref:NADPH-dependent glutamate synthase beta subunit-like oxidoreductase n=1 Tax=Halanaerobium saccharolyticum TaxID=43595 RepID=A0A4R7Z637_9FIRM|nr:FAD-dependent oxidoreductase [Halanaerobium saccharolyticum]RAK10543.1 NADPH-dependent glutamate synthase beta subunit-like oxidoreductase [Halanaerobium saccharolyticum]TDW06700.1 NADPH-dependent glutamate synthase beta subunit-like oxidoreductase [Halanaerobium saccharolyticum]TDX62335.1 NADPH-dependent glutamate synthase beta subunit-like oxidoreductase [Halanaerobium saccharolyticum]
MQLSENLVREINEIINDCLADESPYCQSRCPLNIDVQGYVTLIGEGKYRQALELIRKTIPFPGILGRVCAHPCEEECKRGEIEAALSIKNLKRFAADMADDPEKWDLSRAPETGKKIAIIGAGPAGATAAYDLQKKGHQVEIFESLPVVGGMLRVGIPAYRLPETVIDREYSILEKLGVNIHLNKEVGKDIDFEALKNDYDAVFVAVGAHDAVMIPVEGSDLEGVLEGADFLRKAGLNQEVKIGKKVVVIGGGNVAMDVARTAWRVGAEEIHVACLECRNEMPAHSWEVEDAEEEGIIMHPGWGPQKIGGNKKVESMTFKECTQVFDEAGNFNPDYCEDNLKTIEADNVIFAIGQRADTSFMNEQLNIKEVDQLTLQSEVENVFGGGDCIGKPLLAVEAMSHGKKAAESIDRYLNSKELTENREEEGAYESKLQKELTREEPVRRRIDMRMLNLEERKNNFKEVELGFNTAEAMGEALRCLECECKECIKECIMLDEYSDSPKELFERVKKDEVDPLVYFSCNMCSQCTIACPNDFEIKDKFMQLRKILVKENNGESPIKGHNAIKWHQRLGFSKLFTTTRAAVDEEDTK